MKTLGSLLIAGTLLTGQVGAQSFKAPDILVDSKLDYDWSAVLVTKMRTLLKNYKMKDPFVGHFPQSIMLNESEVGNLLPAESKGLIRDFGNAVGLSILNGETKVFMHGFAYDVKGFKTDLKASEVKSDGLVLGTEFSASEVNLSADKISLSLMIPGKVSSPVFEVEIVRPVIRVTEEKIINFHTDLKIQDNKDFYKLQILKANFDQMANGLVKRPQNVVLDFEKINIPKVSLKIGSRTVNFDNAKIERLIRSKQNAIKGILLAQVASTLKANTAEAAFKVLDQYKLQKEWWFNSPALKSVISIGAVASTTEDNIEINMPGDFCTNEMFDSLKQKCVENANKITKIANTRLTKNLHSESVNVMKGLMEYGDANIVASISEDYLNKLLVTTYDAGLWKETLDEAGVTLGPNKVIMRLDRRGDSGTLIMDVIYKPSKVEKLLTGSKEIRIPLVLDVSVRIEKHDEEPVIIIRLNDVDTSDETLIQGRPQDNIISTVKDVKRFKGKVAAAIREKLSVLKAKDVIELRYPEFKGLGLDKVDFLSDGAGRMNAIMRLEDLLEE